MKPILLLFIASIILSSCGSVKHSDMLMLTDVQDAVASVDSLPVLKIQPDDILNIQVIDEDNNTIGTFQRSSNFTGEVGEKALGVVDGYRVDENGFIYLPYIGQVAAAGKTIMAIREDINTRLVQYLPKANVQVRFVNFKVTLMGEVNRPNTYVIPNERLNIIEAIGMAGDFTPYAKRNSVLVIRERNQIREFHRVNIKDKSVFSSPYFYLSPNDIIIVDPLKAKQYATTGDFFQRYSGIFFPVVSLVTFLLGASLNK
ncbi:MAG: polysaccharide biosynthesis/export family protein [Saprospiraceae bacterium]